MKKIRRILVIDGSRVVRATLSKHLKGDFEILEETNGESAWQTLMLDGTIAAVISGIHTPKLEAFDLLARLRASSIRRLSEIPFVLIVSDIDNQLERDADRARGVAGFITKTMNKLQILACLSQVLERGGEKRVVKEDKSLLAAAVSNSEKLMSCDQFASVLSGLSVDDKSAEVFCALVFGIDNHEALIKQFGEDTAELIATRFAGLLVSKILPQDLIGRCQGERLVILSPGVDLRQGVRFGKRVCKSLASGQITIRGQKIKVTASVGIASTSDDDATTGNELFVLATRRFDQALICGGNTVVTEDKPECPLHCSRKGELKLFDERMAPVKKDRTSRIGTLGLQILPLIQMMDRELSLGLPLDEIRQRLEERAGLECVMT